MVPSNWTAELGVGKGEKEEGIGKKPMLSTVGIKSTMESIHKKIHCRFSLCPFQTTVNMFAHSCFDVSFFSCPHPALTVEGRSGLRSSPGQGYHSVPPVRTAVSCSCLHVSRKLNVRKTNTMPTSS